MTQDFAKRRTAGGATSDSLPGWVWFLTGLAAGVFGSFLFHVWRDIPVDPEVEAIVTKPQADLILPRVEDMEWDFYDIFPKSEVPVVEEYTKGGDKVALEEPSAYLLQAGSFKNPDDADRQRAELILMGMDVFVREVDKDGVTWHRVLVGPIENETDLGRLRRKLAEADIPSLSLRVNP